MKLLDTSVLVDIDRGVADRRLDKLDDEGRHAISIVTVTELNLGLEIQYAESAESKTEARESLERLLSRFAVFEVDRSIALSAASIIGSLRSEGDSLHDLHDVYIGATARTEQLPILTGNTSHFDRMAGVEVLDWDDY